MIHIEADNWPRARANFKGLLKSQFQQRTEINRDLISLRTRDGFHFIASYRDENGRTASGVVDIHRNGWVYGKIIRASDPVGQHRGVLRFSGGGIYDNVTVLSESSLPFWDLAIMTAGDIACILVETAGHFLEAIDGTLFRKR